VTPEEQLMLETFADLVVERVVAALDAREARQARLVDARTLAAMLSVRREWVYQHQAVLGAVRVGPGQGVLRFDPQLATRALDAPPPAAAPATPPARRRARRPPTGQVLRPRPLVTTTRENGAVDDTRFTY
jgi:hypothetical protein